MRTLPSDQSITITHKTADISKPHLVEASRDQLTIIFEHLQSIGAEEQVLTESKQQNSIILSKWFQQLVMRNGLFPSDMPVAFVLYQFFEAVWQDEAKIKGHNLATHIKAFKDWWPQYKDRVRSRWWAAQNPEDRPKALTPQGSRSPEQEAATAAECRESLERIFGKDIPESFKRYADE